MQLQADSQSIYKEAFRHFRAGEFAQSVPLFERALMFRPEDAEAHSNLGAALTMLGRFNDAGRHYERALALKPDLAGIQNNLAVLRMKQGRYPEAIALFERVLSLDRNHAEAHNNLGAIFKEDGRFEDAVTHFDRAIAIRPDYAEAHYNRAEIWKFHAGDGRLRALEKLASRKNLSVEKSICIHFALGKALEDSGDYARAFEQLQKGNALKRAKLGYDPAPELRGLRRIAELFDKRLFDRLQGKGDPSQLPIFILGMPRSGSTLVEQILASHPQIQAAGELRSLDHAAGILNVGGRGIPWPEYFPSLDEPALRRIAESYIASLPAVADGKVRIVDKTPGNFLGTGLIRLVFPKARIIHTSRHPADTCVSCYSKLFESGYYYSYDLANIGRYYRAYRGLMNHFRAILPLDSMLEVIYEDVVNDLEGQARRLIDYCGLPWDERCLSFHETVRPVRTSSAVQVRRPLFRTSLQRWQRFADGLEPLLRELQDIAGTDTRGQSA
ncbi:MAG TPA: sulfotransferase [Bryobacteraceae bacterium]|jgi:tetratricopeptide (TPR) repeat protein|nr:sulfotransferase [Bryobacteraceae bacterium]